MSVRFILGPAGSGKTHRCLAGIRAELLRAPDGPPLLFLAPKQATYQLERQLLEDEKLAGWSRLQILSFDRLARQILAGTRPVELLAEEGRLMVLRALVRRLGPQLRVFHASSRLTGFAQELSGTLRELRNHHLGSSRLFDLAGHLPDHPQLAHKLHDLALLLHAYRAWLAEHHVEDADSLPDLATEALRSGAAPFRLDGLWLDGFAEMTPQELDLLAAVIARSRQSTLAFCLDHAPDTDASWLSTWSIVTQTFRRCHSRLTADADPPRTPVVELLPLPPAPTPTRFSTAPALHHLARTWTRPAPADPHTAEDAVRRIRLVACRDFENEATIAARTILRHVHNGGRFRETAVLVRSLEPAQAILERVFTRYDIPFFLDRRESLAHHPLAELTRSALRLAAFDWARDDWFGALKTDLAGLSATFIDTLENETLAHGWDAAFWRRTAAGQTSELGSSTPAVIRTLQPFQRFVERLGQSPDAHGIARALQALWKVLEVPASLERWQDASLGDGPSAPAHLSAWEQVQAWLENLERGFGTERLPLTEWLPILEAGLTALTAGVIPSSQDQVLIGAIDRSRQPDLRLALILGLNEGRFPAPPADGGMLTDTDRARLLQAGVLLGPDRRRRVGHERYFGYIACTRSREQLILTWSERGDDGGPLNPSPFLRELQAMFPGLPIDSSEIEDIPAHAPPGILVDRLVHDSELLPWLLARDTPSPLDGLAGDDLRRAWLRQFRIAPATSRILPSLAAALHGTEPEVSVSALESMGACPFQFLVRHTLRGTERDRFETDGRILGSLAHELLAQFHLEIRSTGRQWRDLSADDARSTFDRVAARVVPAFSDGVCTATAEARWQTTALVSSLRELAAQLVAWAPTGDFQPVAAELAFGFNQPLPPWHITLGNSEGLRVRGKIDRVDVARAPDGTGWFLVLDYKLRRPALSDALIAGGIDLQLAAYARALARIPGWFPSSSPDRIAPAGIFFIGLRGRPEGRVTRNDAPPPAAERAAIHIHRGRFREDALDRLDFGARSAPSGRFAFSINKNGSLRQGGDGRPDAGFEALLDSAEEAVRRLASRILSGDAAVAPFARGRRTACDRCELADVCRFDPSTQAYRRLG